MGGSTVRAIPGEEQSLIVCMILVKDPNFSASPPEPSKFWKDKG